MHQKEHERLHLQLLIMSVGVKLRLAGWGDKESRTFCDAFKCFSPTPFI